LPQVAVELEELREVKEPVLVALLAKMVYKVLMEMHMVEVLVVILIVIMARIKLKLQGISQVLVEAVAADGAEAMEVILQQMV
jgi:hypothetical protein